MLFTVTLPWKFLTENSDLSIEPERAWQNGSFLNWHYVSVTFCLGIIGFQNLFFNCSYILCLWFRWFHLFSVASRVCKKTYSLDFLFDFDPRDSPMEEGVSTRGPTNFEETFIFTCQIGLWKSNSIPKTSQILNKFRQNIPLWFLFPYSFFARLLEGYSRKIAFLAFFASQHTKLTEKHERFKLIAPKPVKIDISWMQVLLQIPVSVFFIKTKFSHFRVCFQTVNSTMNLKNNQCCFSRARWKSDSKSCLVYMWQPCFWNLSKISWTKFVIKSNFKWHIYVAESYWAYNKKYWTAWTMAIQFISLK